jgi:ribA/ribD-fused uncharacterized protein
MDYSNYHFFWKDKYLNQWSYSPFVDVINQKFYCAEQYMMYHKALLFDDLDIANKILLVDVDPPTIKQLGRLVKKFNYDVWKDYRETIVYDGNILKFRQNQDHYNYLISTGDKILVEASPFDLIYGIGLNAVDAKMCSDSSVWPGLNLLGKILMKVRSDIR